MRTNINEFIVWHNEKKKFVPTKNNMFVSSSNKLVPCSRCELFSYIGKTDINNKKIYTDCSIVEFEKWDKKNNEVIVNKLKGFFTYCEETLRYKIELFENDIYATLFMQYDYKIAELKIIDTIQENKLGLIK